MLYSLCFVSIYPLLRVCLYILAFICTFKEKRVLLDLWAVLGDQVLLAVMVQLGTQVTLVRQDLLDLKVNKQIK